MWTRTVHAPRAATQAASQQALSSQSVRLDSSGGKQDVPYTLLSYTVRCSNILKRSNQCQRPGTGLGQNGEEFA